MKTRILFLLCIGALSALVGAGLARSALGAGAVFALFGLLLRALYLLDEQARNAARDSAALIEAAGTVSKLVAERDALRNERDNLRDELERASR